MVNIEELITDPDFAQQYYIYRKSGGQWIEGNFVQSEIRLSYEGFVGAATSRDINQVAEADRVTGMVVFYSTPDKMIYTTRKNDSEGTGTSDEILWHNERYKVINAFDYQDYGFVKAIGVRKEQV